MRMKLPSMKYQELNSSFAFSSFTSSLMLQSSISLLIANLHASQQYIVQSKLAFQHRFPRHTNSKHNLSSRWNECFPIWEKNNT
jgi:hypothetical protein